jgi:hypothetical protein
MALAIVGTSTEIRRLMRAIDGELGYPRTHVDGEPGFVRGANVRGVIATQRHNWPRRNGTQYAYPIDAVVAALHGRVATINDGGSVQVTIDTSTATERDLSTWTEERGL